MANMKFIEIMRSIN